MLLIYDLNNINIKLLYQYNFLKLGYALWSQYNRLIKSSNCSILYIYIFFFYFYIMFNVFSFPEVALWISLCWLLSKSALFLKWSLIFSFSVLLVRSTLILFLYCWCCYYLIQWPVFKSFFPPKRQTANIYFECVVKKMNYIYSYSEYH